eukprot:1682791-Rhodomonas_salina.1
MKFRRTWHTWVPGYPGTRVLGARGTRVDRQTLVLLLHYPATLQYQYYGTLGNALRPKLGAQGQTRAAHGVGGIVAARVREFSAQLPSRLNLLVSPHQLVPVLVRGTKFQANLARTLSDQVLTHAHPANYPDTGTPGYPTNRG